MIELLNIDCMDYMASCHDKKFDLAIVDPPYFDGPQKENYYTGTKQRAKTRKYDDLQNWDVPNKKYFDELIRISRNQIIWGINYFNICLPGGRIVWIKGAEKSPFSMCDIAYHSFYNRIDMFKYLWSGFWQETGNPKETRIHPTQKPVALYRWLLDNYAKTGNLILDTHAGSFSSAVACKEKGFDGVFCELDTEYFEGGKNRVDKASRQYELIKPEKNIPVNYELI